MYVFTLHYVYSLLFLPQHIQRFFNLCLIFSPGYIFQMIILYHIPPPSGIKCVLLLMIQIFILKKFSSIRFQIIIISLIFFFLHEHKLSIYHVIVYFQNLSC